MTVLPGRLGRRGARHYDSLVRCWTCQYDLSELVEHRCPECSRAFDPNDAATFDAGRMRPGVRKAIRIAVWLLVILAILAGIAATYVYWALSTGLGNYKP